MNKIIAMYLDMGVADGASQIVIFLWDMKNMKNEELPLIFCELMA